jgi:hypothetical protein
MSNSPAGNILNMFFIAMKVHICALFQGEFCEERLDPCISSPCYPGKVSACATNVVVEERLRSSQP